MSVRDKFEDGGSRRFFGRIDFIPAPWIILERKKPHSWRKFY